MVKPERAWRGRYRRLAAVVLTGILAGATCLSPCQADSATTGSINAGNRQASAEKPFVTEEIASFDTPWALAFLPDGQMLVTEKPGKLYLVTPQGKKTPVDHVPAVAAAGQNGLLDVAISPGFSTNREIYLTYVEPGDHGGRLALAKAQLERTAEGANLVGLEVIWRQEPEGGRGQPGGIIAFDPEGKHLYLTSGDRMVPDTAQDRQASMGKVLRLNLDGSTPEDNPEVSLGGVRGQTFTLGHRNPYGLAFASDGKLWLHEMGPRGGDELNLLEPGRNYGWPEVSNGDNYDGTAIPRHKTRPEFAAPPLYWTPVIAPAGLAFYEGNLFPAWKGSALIGGLKAMALVRVTFDNGTPDEAERFDMEARIRDVTVGPDGAVYLLEDDSPGRLLRLLPTGK